MKEYNTFEKITTNDQAYLIGYLCGDGGVNGINEPRTTRMSLSSSDEETIIYLAKFFGDLKISSRIPVNCKRPEIKSDRLSYRINFPVKYSKVFNKFGILSYKKDRTLVNISRRNMRPYLLGLFDADGCITFGNRKDRNRLWGKINFTHPSYKLLESIQRFLDEELGISSRIAPKGVEKCFVLEFAKLDNVYKFCKYLYPEDYSGYYLKRKQQKALQFCHQIGLKRESYVN